MRRKSSRRRSAARVEKFRVVAVITAGIASLCAIGIWSGATRVDESADNSETAEVAVFTLVASGIVYVDPGSSQVIWMNTDGLRRVIGEAPWQDPRTPRASSVSRFAAWRDNRDLVGNPDFDLVAWVEPGDRGPGNVVVVQASTGTVLARMTVQAAPDQSVVIASVNDQALYLAMPNPETGFPDIPSEDIRIWNWAADAEMTSFPPGRYYADVSAGVGAVYGSGVEFENQAHQTFATADSSDERTDFGWSLSPDGRYFYAAGSSHIVETATGHVVNIAAARQENYGWTGRGELTFTNPLITCSALTGQCRGPTASGTSLCAPFGLNCGNHLPVN